MKRKLLYLGIASLMLMATSCKDYLDTSSNSKFDNSFVFADETGTFNAVLNLYGQVQTGNFIGDRVTMNLNGPGSDYELRPDYTTSGRGSIINLYPTGFSDFNAAEGSSQWNQGYKAINIANEIIAGVEAVNPNVATATTPTNMTHMYGEALVLRALCYFELVRNFGDIPLMITPAKAGMDFYIPTTNRWVILDKMLEDLERVAPMMMWSSELPQKSERVSRGFAYGLIAKIALTRGGYSLHPNGEGLSDWGTVERDEANWRKYYEQANKALKTLVASGKHQLQTTDTRTAGTNGAFGNPFQKIFQDQMDYVINNESLWECSMARDYGGNWGYAYARVHTGGNNGNVSKAFAAMRFTPNYYYSFDLKDMRRDVTCAVTGTAGAGAEMIINPGSIGDGGFNGICLNKWDKMRMANIYNTGNGKAGINFVYMRYADAILLLAETEAVLGGDAKTPLMQVRGRAFSAADQAEKVTNYVAGLSGDELLKAIKMERAWEFGGENQRKHDLIRWGEFNKAIVDAQSNIKAIAEGVRTNRSYTFPNGLQISDSLYIKNMKSADIKNGVVVGTTYGTPAGKENDPILAPGWRGVGDAAKFTVAPTSLLAIQGLNKALTTEERAALRAAGYKSVVWADAFLGANRTGYSAYVTSWWSGYSKSLYDAGKPARYFCPIPGPVITAANGVMRNYYGFANQ